jgi:NAD+ synthase (glutamine-hydrolysing)
MEHIWQSLVDGIRKFCKENGFSDVALGLSGGLDSAVVAVAAAEALGGEHVHAFMMKTVNTSDLSLSIAKQIAKLNYLDFKEIDIQHIIDDQTAFLQSLFVTKPKNIVLENLQARERGKILMSISNQFNYLILACSNKSELAMGYCTLYGDTCGGLAPIADIYKSDIFELAKWRNSINTVFPDDVITRAPSAELSKRQKDEDTLPPYAVLDKILKLYIEENQTLEQLASKGFDIKTVNWIISRYKSQAFKRLQIPTSVIIKKPL